MFLTENISTWHQRTRSLWVTVTASLLYVFVKLPDEKRTKRDYASILCIYPTVPTYLSFSLRNGLPDLFPILIFEEIRRRKNAEPSSARMPLDSCIERKQRKIVFFPSLFFFLFFFSLKQFYEHTNLRRSFTNAMTGKRIPWKRSTTCALPAP